MKLFKQKLNYIALTREAVWKYRGITLYDVADDYYSADKRREMTGVYIGKRHPRYEDGYVIIVAFDTIDDLQSFRLNIHKK